MHSERCPLCHGEGKYIPEGWSIPIYNQPCHGCNGKGWIEVKDEEIPFRYTWWNPLEGRIETRGDGI